jgi:hypothetical protein
VIHNPYFSLVDKPQISISERLKLNLCKQTLKNNNIQSHSDYDRLKVLQQETDKKTTALKNSFENCYRLYNTYSDIEKTYYEISKGDYVSNLVAEEQKKRERDEQQKKRAI